MLEVNNSIIEEQIFILPYGLMFVYFSDLCWMTVFV